MLPDRFEAITVTDVEGLLEAFRARKEALELSNATIDELGGLCAGHADKVLGPSRIKGLSTMTLDVLLGVLALKLVVVEYPEAAARIVDRWGIRSKPHVRARCSRVSMKVLESARHVLDGGRSVFDHRCNSVKATPYRVCVKYIHEIFSKILLSLVPSKRLPTSRVGNEVGNFKNGVAACLVDQSIVNRNTFSRDHNIYRREIILN